VCQCHCDEEALFDGGCGVEEPTEGGERSEFQDAVSGEPAHASGHSKGAALRGGRGGEAGGADSEQEKQEEEAGIACSLQVAPSPGAALRAAPPVQAAAEACRTPRARGRWPSMGPRPLPRLRSVRPRGRRCLHTPWPRPWPPQRRTRQKWSWPPPRERPWPLLCPRARERPRTLRKWSWPSAGPRPRC